MRICQAPRHDSGKSRSTAWLVLLGMVLSPLTGHAETQLNIIYLSQQENIPPALSNLDPIPQDQGIQGARLGLTDNNTTGRFLDQHYSLSETQVPVDGDPAAAFTRLLSEGHRHFVLDVPASSLEKIVSSAGDQDVVLLDVRSRDDGLRSNSCNRNLLHLQPSRAMLADALAQYALKKRWKKWFLVRGPGDDDRLFAEAIKRSAKRLQLNIVAEKTWDHTHDARRTAQSEVPVFTQGVDYDLLVVADEAGLFGEYLMYRTWKPLLVAGTQGLVPTSWHRTHEQWGAVQLQNRFSGQANRWMNERDYAAWLAVRALGEAVTRTGKTDAGALMDYLLGDQFALAGFKGKPLSFRAWNGQLRQPILLAAARSMVAVAPLEGFLHPRNELDSLGYDKPEVSCKK